MKKILCFLLCGVMLFALVGCGGNIKELERNETFLSLQAKKAVNGFMIDGEGAPYPSYFLLKPDEFIKQFNEKAAVKSYRPLVELNPEPAEKRDKQSHFRYTSNNETWNILVKTKEKDETGAGYIKEVELDLFAVNNDDSKRNGDYLYFLMDMFNPGMAEEISDALNIFGEDQDKLPAVRTLYCGNVEYTYIYHKSTTSEFHIKAVDIAPQQSPTPKGAVRPE